jgi:hypothetical protein
MHVDNLLLGTGEFHLGIVSVIHFVEAYLETNFKIYLFGLTE